MVKPASVTFLLCIEGNAIEQQALLLCESIRRFGGRYAKSPILAVSPRPELPISALGGARLAELDVQHFSLPLNRTGSTYLSINRIVAGAWTERNVSTDYIVVLDSDTIFVGEPPLLCCDAGARPVDAKGNTSAGSSDPLDSYWRRICEIAGIDIDRLPWLETTIDRVHIRASFNGGFTVVRRSCGILAKTAEIFLASLGSDLRPLRHSTSTVFASTGYVGRDATLWWGSSQAALSAAIAARANELMVYDDRYNIPLHLLVRNGDNQVPWPTCEPVLLHYHWLIMREHHAAFLDVVQSVGVPDDWRRWLRARLDQIPASLAPAS